MLKFDDRVALITGAGRGVGRSHALLLAERGAKVIVNDFGVGLRGEGAHSEPANAVAEEIRDAGGEAMAAYCDIGDEGEVERMVAAAVERYGRIDILIHNASTYAELSSFADARLADLERIFRVNVAGGWNVAHAAWSSMRDNGYGRIVMTGSGAGYFGRRKDHAYSIAKGALMPLTKVLAAEGEKIGIKANLIGPIAFTEHAQLQGIPPIMEQVAPPDRVTALAAVLCHEACPVNGEMFHCGGGFAARVFIGETVGTAFAGEDMTPEAVMGRMDAVMDLDNFAIPANSDQSGARLSAAIASVNDDFAEALAEAKRSRSRAE